MYRRICLFAGPAAGKSTTAARLFSELKMRHFNVELVTEYVKTWAHIGRKVKSFDQVYFFAKQIHMEDRLLYSGSNLIITDSPLWLSCTYAKRNKMHGWENLMELAKEFDKQYPAMNIFLDRGDKKYHKEGRYETYDEAIQMDNFMLEVLEENLKGKYVKAPYSDFLQIFGYVIGELAKDVKACCDGLSTQTDEK